MKKIKLLVIETDDVILPGQVDVEASDVVLLESLDNPRCYRIVESNYMPLRKDEYIVTHEAF